VATLTKKEKQRAIEAAKVLAHQVGTLPASKLWIDFDEEADVLYISFQRPQHATETVEAEEGILFRYRDNELVGITVLDASKR
jgi:uncharacterized protein YuzE